MYSREFLVQAFGDLSQSTFFQLHPLEYSLVDNNLQQILDSRSMLYLK